MSNGNDCPIIFLTKHLKFMLKDEIVRIPSNYNEGTINYGRFTFRSVRTPNVEKCLNIQ